MLFDTLKFLVANDLFSSPCTHNYPSIHLPLFHYEKKIIVYIITVMRGNDTTFRRTSASHLSSNMQSQAAKRDIGDYIVQHLFSSPHAPTIPTFFFGKTVQTLHKIKKLPPWTALKLKSNPAPHKSQQF
jgi:hypothetical protein